MFKTSKARSSKTLLRGGGRAKPSSCAGAPVDGSIGEVSSESVATYSIRLRSFTQTGAGMERAADVRTASSDGCA